MSEPHPPGSPADHAISRARATANRTLQACRSCLCILDVSGLAVGTSMRCRCGAVACVETSAPITVQALVCNHCGGAFQAGAATCPWCEAGITFEDRRLGAICPACCARVASDARFCPGCGVAVGAQALSALPADAACPRCRSTLRARVLDAQSLVECVTCAGLWLAAGVLENFCERADDAAFAQSAITTNSASAHVVHATGERAYLPCVTCREPMMRRNFGGSSGVLVDVCKDHGVWLDHDELERVLAFVRGGGLVRARERERARSAKERERRNEATSPTAHPAQDPWCCGSGRVPRPAVCDDSDLFDVLGYIGSVIVRSLSR